MQEFNDMELVKQAQSGSVAAVGELYDRHRSRIFRYIRFKTANTQVAQDLTSEVFLRMVDNLPSFQLRGVPFSAWLYRIARNLIIKQGQKESNWPVVSLGYADNVSRNGDNPALVVERQMEMERIWQGLERINEIQREVILLRFIGGLSLKETSQIMEKTVAAIKTLQHRGVLALQVVLANERQEAQSI
jgi:RNA polymerase sigma-70 factor (ECF subfamily)